MSPIYRNSAQLYDFFSKHKDYLQAARSLQQLIRDNRSDARTLLDVACGTGGHLEYLRKDFDAEGMDLSDDMLKIAREKCPGLVFHQGDFTDFDLHKEFDVVICMFGSIGYSGHLGEMRDAIVCMAHHLKDGGVLILEPWLTPETYLPGRITADFIDEPNCKGARIYINQLQNDKSVFDIEYLIADSTGVQRFSEKHSLGLFSHEDYQDALELAGLQVLGNVGNLFGYGLFAGIKRG